MRRAPMGPARPMAGGQWPPPGPATVGGQQMNALQELSDARLGGDAARPYSGGPLVGGGGPTGKPTAGALGMAPDQTMELRGPSSLGDRYGGSIKPQMDPSMAMTTGLWRGPVPGRGGPEMGMVGGAMPRPMPGPAMGMAGGSMTPPAATPYKPTPAPGAAPGAPAPTPYRPMPAPGAPAPAPAPAPRPMPSAPMRPIAPPGGGMQARPAPRPGAMPARPRPAPRPMAQPMRPGAARQAMQRAAPRPLKPTGQNPGRRR